MLKFHRVFVIALFLFLFSTFANAQAMMSYLYLEVVDSSQKPLQDAKIDYPLPFKTETAIIQTDEKGLARFEFWEPGPGPRLSEFIITKPDFYPFDLFGLLRGAFSENWSQSYRREKLTVELFKVPKNKDEKKTLGDEQLKREFFSAVLKGDATTVRKMLKSDINPNITTDELRGVPHPKEIPAMLYAADNLDLEIMNEFLAAKVNLRQENSNIRNILAYYIGSSNEIKTKENVSYQERRNIFNKYAETLIKAGANPNSTNLSGETSLTLATKRFNPELVKILIEKGADINAKNKIGTTTLMEAFDLRMAYTDTQAIAWRNEIINLLLKSGANPNIGYDDGYRCHSPLMYAVEVSSIEWVKLLLSYKADANLKCRKTVNALTRLVWQNNPNYAELLDILIEAGADVNAADEYGNTPLMTAVSSGNIPVIKKLLSKGALVNAQNSAGGTALMNALLKEKIGLKPEEPNIEIVRLLLEAGANPNLTVNSNSEASFGTALSSAVWYPPRWSPEEITYASNDIIKLLIANKADLNLTIGDKDTPLISAVKGARIDALKILIEAGANVNAKNSLGETALKIAWKYLGYYPNRSEYNEVIKILVEAGAK